MLCSFCGLETGGASSHETQQACIEALRQQVTHLKDVLEHARRPGEELAFEPATSEQQPRPARKPGEQP